MYVQHVHRPDVRTMVRHAITGSVLVLVLWGGVALIAWGVNAVVDSAPAAPASLAALKSAPLAGPAAPVASGAQPGLVEAGQPGDPGPASGAPAPAQPAAGHYADQTYGFSFDYPDEWTPSPLAPADPPGAVLGLPATSVPGSVGGVEFPYSSHIDLSLIVQDTAAPGGTAWGAAPSDILAQMVASTGQPAAAAEGTAVRETTAGGVEVWSLKYVPANATERMWVVAQAGRFNYLFFLTVGGAADDRGTVQQMFEEVVPSFRLDSQT